MPRMFEHHFVFEVIEDGFDKRSFAQEYFFLKIHQNIFHIVFDSGD